MLENFTEIKLTNETMDRLINPFSDFDERWALLTSGSGLKREEWNTMTVSWGSVGILWNKIVAIVYVRPNRHTYTFIEKNEGLSLSFFDNNAINRKILEFCGTKSGRDYDKAVETGLKPFRFGNNFISFEQASLILACKKLYIGKLRPEQFIDKTIIEKNYPRKDFHSVYICEIVSALSKN